MDKIIDYEMGMLDEAECLELFAMLIRTGQVWQLQGHYGRTAQALIDNGVLTADGQPGILLRN
jgi:hypothetical protein